MQCNGTIYKSRKHAMTMPQINNNQNTKLKRQIRLQVIVEQQPLRAKSHKRASMRHGCSLSFRVLRVLNRTKTGINRLDGKQCTNSKRRKYKNCEESDEGKRENDGKD